jgi:hypothetical protein
VPVAVLLNSALYHSVCTWCLRLSKSNTVYYPIHHQTIGLYLGNEVCSLWCVMWRANVKLRCGWGLFILGREAASMDNWFLTFLMSLVSSFSRKWRSGETLEDERTNNVFLLNVWTQLPSDGVSYPRGMELFSLNVVSMACLAFSPSC